MGCSPKCAKWTTISLAVVVLVVGMFLAISWEKLYNRIVNHQLSVSSSDTTGFKKWKETPIPMYLEVHLFNWTNPDNTNKNPGVKPSFVEMGPYMFYEHHIKENITFNDNDTVTFLNKRIWHFRPDLSVGSLDDNVTVLNPIAIFVTNFIKNQDYLVKRVVNFLLKDLGEPLAVTKTVRDLLFDGYKDVLIDLAGKLNISALKLPFKRFGWYVNKNGTATADGVFNMYSGGLDITKLGVVTRWNYEHQTKYYPDECGIVDGTTGELWYPPHNDDEVAIFANDMCSNVKLRRNGTASVHGVEGHLFKGEADVFDNGTYYNSSKCFASGVPAGVRDVSICKTVDLTGSVDQYLEAHYTDSITRSAARQRLTLALNKHLGGESPPSGLNFQWDKSSEKSSDLAINKQGEKWVYEGPTITIDEQRAVGETTALPKITKAERYRYNGDKRFGAPAYVSFPHFYLADPVYRTSIDGMSPDPDKHATRIILEPHTGLPLRVNAAFQINLLMRNIKGIDMFSHIKDTMMPCLWFIQKAELSEELASLAKLMILSEKLGTGTGYGLIGLGVVLLCAFVFITFRSKWKSNDDDEQPLLNPETL